MNTALTSRRWGAFMRVILLSFFSIVLTTPLLAQETTSAIRGRVLGSDGQPLPNTQVTVVDERTGITRSFTTNATGTFLAAKLPAGGPYTVTVTNSQPVTVERISLGDTYNMSISLEAVEEVVVTGTTTNIVDVAAGPAAAFSSYEIDNSVAFDRDITDVYGTDPRINIDNEDDGFEVNCAGKHPRFNSLTLDGVSQNDRFGLNSNGYSTATGMPFPFDAIDQIAVELAPFDVTYGGFSACNINSVTKAGTNEFEGKVFYEYTNEDFRGDELGGTDENFATSAYDEKKYGFSVGGPLIKDKLFFFGAYEQSEEPRFLAIGYDGSGNGTERDWLSEADYNRILNIAQTVYNYDAGGQPSDGAQENEKYLVRLDWNINERHNLAGIYNYFDGFQDRNSDGDDDEFEFSNHFYVKGAESETTTLILQSQWNDAFSTEFFYSMNEMNDSQVTVGPPDFADMQISIGGRTGTVYLGADDSRQANKLNTESDFFKLKGQYLFNDHVFSFGYESEELTIFNQFVQHSNGGEYDYFDDSGDNPAFCAALTAQQRFDDPDCELSGIDRFELGRPSRIYYGSGGGTNNPDDAAANFSNRLNSVYFQDELFFNQHDLTVVAGLRYDWFTSDDS
ncbi:MAG: TonB-dependent receptor, partial [Gammaproteobacteria bacterium]|nr:TonB-dependent receptor [Gammaproteobacteria bacterium]